jgi:hypothetical protein
LNQMISTGTPKHGASAADTRRRPWPTAATPQRRQPARSASVSTVITSLRRPRRTSNTCMPSALNIASAREHQRAGEPHLQSSMSGSSIDRRLGRSRS